MMYYYRRKTSKIKWLIIIIILAGLGFGLYWFYVNYFSKIDFSKPEEAVAEPVKEQDEIFKTLDSSLMMAEGQVEIASGNEDYVMAEKGRLLQPGDKIRTGAASRAIIVLGNGSAIRLSAQTEIVLKELNNTKVLINQLKGRSYHVLKETTDYQLTSLNTQVITADAKFEVITNIEQQVVAILCLAQSLQAELNDDQGLIVASRLIAGEKAVFNTQAAKNNLMKIDTFTEDSLEKEDWYQWNFDLDANGLVLPEEQPEEDPDFSITDKYLTLAAEEKDTGVFLSWSAYTDEEFASYQVVHSETVSDLKYPDNSVIKTSTIKGLNSFVHLGLEADSKHFYRICVVKTTDKVICGNVAEIQTAKTEESEPETDTQAPQPPNLSGSISVEGVNLSWSQNQEDDFKEYKVLRSQTNMLPNYPAEQIAIRFRETSFYLDNTVNITSVGMYYYRVCAADQSDNYSCSNVVIIENGKMR